MSRQTPQDAVRDTAPEAPERAATTFYIREVADVVGVSPAVIRSWERQGLLAPARASNGYRLYSYDDVEHARRIRDLLQRDGLNAASAAGSAPPRPPPGGTPRRPPTRTPRRSASTSGGCDASRASRCARWPRRPAWAPRTSARWSAR
jgi:hypothetical protein